MGAALQYVGWFILGYLLLVHWGWDNYILPQWILIFIVAIHKQIPILIRKIYEKI